MPGGRGQPPPLSRYVIGLAAISRAWGIRARPGRRSGRRASRVPRCTSCRMWTDFPYSSWVATGTRPQASHGTTC